MKQVLLDSALFYDRVAILENGKLIDFLYEEKNENNVLGNIYKGRVINILPGMNAAFVDVGLDKNAYLYIDALLSDKFLREKKISKNDITNISEVLKKGDEILVQINREPIGEKNISITTDITIPGKCMALIPKSCQINISKKISNKDERKQIKDIGNEIIIDDYGMIIRTYAKEKDKESLEKEYNLLLSTYRKIEKEFNYSYAPKLMYKSNGLLEKVFRDYIDMSVDSIYVEDIITKEKVLNLIKTYDLSGDLNNIKIVDVYPSLFEKFNLINQINSLFNRKVELKNGGSIFIDITEAMTIIDVNSGKFIGSYNMDETALEINMTAAEEIARQVKLRNISGIIIIDFIDMKNIDYVEMLIKKVKNSFKNDKATTRVLGMTKLNLLEMTRKKDKDNFFNLMTEVCKNCNGSGMVISETYIIYKIENIIKKVQTNTSCDAILLSAGIGVFNKLKNFLDKNGECINKKSGIEIFAHLDKNDGEQDIKIDKMGKLDYVRKYII